MAAATVRFSELAARPCPTPNGGEAPHTANSESVFRRKGLSPKESSLAGKQGRVLKRHSVKTHQLNALVLELDVKLHQGDCSCAFRPYIGYLEGLYRVL